MRSGGKKRPSILADALEAVIGAVYLDAGFVAAQQLVHRLFKNVEINPTMAALGKDPKTELQEWLQGRKMKLPLYRVVGTLGAAHQQSFDVECEIVELGLCETRHWRFAPRGGTGRRGGHVADPEEPRHRHMSMDSDSTRLHATGTVAAGCTGRPRAAA